MKPEYDKLAGSGDRGNSSCSYQAKLKLKAIVRFKMPDIEIINRRIEEYVRSNT